MRPTPLTDEVVADWRTRGDAVPSDVRNDAARIVADVRTRGDDAVLELTARFDGARLDQLRLPDDEWATLADEVPAPLRAALGANLARIEAFHSPQVPAAYEVETAPGVVAGRRPVAHRVAACYVPGGRASYPSTVLMTAALARLAGVPRIVVLTPPGDDGSIDPAVAYAAKISGATDIIRCGGAQAVAAAAYGTATVPQADVIVGPGNAYVTAAKAIVAAEGRVWTDAPAGPSELLVLADETADADRIAWDLLAQAEHDPDAECIVITTDAALATRIAERVAALATDEPRAAIIQASLTANGRILIADDLDTAISAANAYGAEHLEIHTRDADAVAARIHDAGSIFIGAHAPVSLGDYGTGTNHVLPTMGQARIRGGLAVSDFMKWITWQRVTPEGLAGIASDITAVAEAEGLAAHASAVTRRLA